MLQHYHLPPPSWFFMGQLNPESYLPLGQAKFVKYFCRLNQSMYFWIFTFFIMAQYMVNIVLYWLPGKLTSNRASWNYAKFAPPPLHPPPPWQVLSKIVCQPCCLTDNVSWCVLREDMLRLPVTCCCLFFSNCWGLVGLGRFIGASI